MAHNEINRHSRGDRSLKPDTDSLFMIDLSAKGDISKPNWLTIIEKNAYIIIRLYSPV
ncbi:DUF1214 domain-containing protein [Cronobacter dublinensis]|jgi:hypothetical protein|nr:DUF1214 domain-containing protein [Enterobacter asburiae]ELH8611025.1 DUF1214 domain-containing protein [Enterobacter asburiae]